jgi:hypothetical protein
MERALGARGARLLLVAGGTIALTLSAPTSLIEELATASGLSEMVKFFAPPIGLGSRLLLGGILALVPAAVVWTLWGAPAAPAEPQPDYEAELLEIEDEDEMMHARRQASGSGWGGALLRLVRGGFHDNGDAQDNLSRRRRDRHPDAPPRPPLSASRDLPPPEPVSAVVEPAPVEVAAFVAPVESAPTVAAPTLAEVIAHAAPAPMAAPDPLSSFDMPRAPVPLSEEEIAHVVAAMPPRKAAAASTAPFVRESCATLLRTLNLPLIADADLGALAARFERSVAKREAVAQAAQAQQSLDGGIGYAQPDPSVRAALRAQRPVEIVPPSAPAFAAEATSAQTELLRVDADVEHALSSALATLRKLTEQGRR